MPRPRKPPEEVKKNLTVRIKQKLLTTIKDIPNYNQAVEKVLNDNFGKKE